VAQLVWAQDQGWRVVALAEAVEELAEQVLAERVGPVGGGVSAVEVDVVHFDLAQTVPHHDGRGNLAAAELFDGRGPGGRRQVGGQLGEAGGCGTQVFDLLGEWAAGAGVDVGGAGFGAWVRRRANPGARPVEQVDVRVGVAREVGQHVPPGPPREGRRAVGVAERGGGAQYPVGGLVELRQQDERISGHTHDPTEISSPPAGDDLTVCSDASRRPERR
jgi:hypothetical protein